MIKLTEVSGVIKGLFTNEELDKVVELMSKLNSNDPKKTADWNPIGIGHMLYSWFEKKIFNKIIENFEDHQNIKMTFGSFTNERKPFNVHSDYYHKRENEPCIAILIPLSVDHGKGDITKSSTIVFNETDTYFDSNVGPTAKQYPSAWRDTHNIEKENNATIIHDTHLSHCDKDGLKYLTVQNILEWHRGDAIWWDEKNLHSSNNFIKNNIVNKQFIVIHTYKTT